MQIEEAILKISPHVYEDVTNEFCKVTNIDPKNAHVVRFRCPVGGGRSLQVSFSLDEHWAMFSAENNTKCNVLELMWIKDFFETDIDHSTSSFSLIRFDKAL